MVRTGEKITRHLRCGIDIKINILRLLISVQNLLQLPFSNTMIPVIPLTYHHYDN